MTGTLALEKLAITWLEKQKYCTVAIRNVYFYDWESDDLGITRSDFVHEVEVKVSQMDFAADFRNKKGKHYSTKYGRGANYFWYCVPWEMKEYCLARLPEYAGLLVKSKYGYLQVAQKAPELHSNKITPARWKELAIKLFYKLNLKS